MILYTGSATHTSQPGKETSVVAIQSVVPVMSTYSATGTRYSVPSPAIAEVINFNSPNCNSPTYMNDPSGGKFESFALPPGTELPVIHSSSGISARTTDRVNRFKSAVTVYSPSSCSINL